VPHAGGGGFALPHAASAVADASVALNVNVTARGKRSRGKVALRSSDSAQKGQRISDTRT
jgi:hypothetical protein